MSIKRNIFAIALMLVFILLHGCGGGAGSDGKGNTVYIEPHITTGQPMALTIDPIGTLPYTTALVAAKTGFTFKSTSYPHTNGIPASSVIITSAKISYTPMIASSGSISPSLTSWEYPYYALIVPPDTDSSKIENLNIVDTIRMIEMDNALSAGITYYYNVNVQFIGKELNTDLSITCKPLSGLLTVRK